VCLKLSSWATPRAYYLCHSSQRGAADNTCWNFFACDEPLYLLAACLDRLFDHDDDGCSKLLRLRPRPRLRLPLPLLLQAHWMRDVVLVLSVARCGFPVLQNLIFWRKWSVSSAAVLTERRRLDASHSRRKGQPSTGAPAC
jgi:hypothetical protein